MLSFRIFRNNLFKEKYGLFDAKESDPSDAFFMPDTAAHDFETFKQAVMQYEENLSNRHNPMDTFYNELQELALLYDLQSPPTLSNAAGMKLL